MERFNKVAEDKKLHDELDKKIQGALEETKRYTDILTAEVDVVESLNKELLSIKEKMLEDANAQKENKRAAIETIGDYKKSLSSMLVEAKKESARLKDMITTNNGMIE
jgi:uncharacterized protein YoxC